MIDERDLLERALRRFEPQPGLTDRVYRRRDRKRRNHRITAGVVGIVVFVAAVWIVWDVASLNRTQTAVVPGGASTGPSVTGPRYGGARYGEPDVVRRGECHPPAGLMGEGLQLFDLGDRIRVRFHLVSMSGPWGVVLRHTHIPAIAPPEVVYRGTRMPRHNIPGHFIIIRYVTDLVGVDEFQAKAVDPQTGQVCMAVARIE